MLNGLGNGMTIPAARRPRYPSAPSLPARPPDSSAQRNSESGAAATILIGHFVTIWPQSLAWNLFLFVLLGWASLAGFVGRRD